MDSILEFAGEAGCWASIALLIWGAVLSLEEALGEGDRRTEPGVRAGGEIAPTAAGGR
jgi:hypothetical protein